MKIEEIFAAWTPDESAWSLWAKPVLFATMLPYLQNRDDQDDPLPVFPGIPRRSREVAIVVDLSGEDSVQAGLALAQEGYRPVPLFNGAAGPAAIVNVVPTIRALIEGVRQLRRVDLPPDASPAFLLDARRLANADQVRPERFDNRWCVLPQDMPSATRLKEAGITRVLLIADVVLADLAHVLLRYEEAGLKLSILKPDFRREEPIKITRPPRYRSFWYRLGVLAGLRRNSAGGFGAIVPDPNASGTGGFG